MSAYGPETAAKDCFFALRDRAYELAGTAVTNAGIKSPTRCAERVLCHL